LQCRCILPTQNPVIVSLPSQLSLLIFDFSICIAGFLSLPLFFDSLPPLFNLAWVCLSLPEGHYK
jgi:hypothetical protein